LFEVVLRIFKTFVELLKSTLFKRHPNLLYEKYGPAYEKPLSLGLGGSIVKESHSGLDWNIGIN